MILFSVVLSTLLWVDIVNPYVWIVLWVFLGFGLIGIADDYAKLTRQSHRGVPGRLRLFLEGVIALVAGVTVSTIVGVGLMALVFYSSRHGYDDMPTRDDSDEPAPHEPGDEHRPS